MAFMGSGAHRTHQQSHKLIIGCLNNSLMMKSKEKKKKMRVVFIFIFKANVIWKIRVHITKEKIDLCFQPWLALRRAFN